MKNDRTRKTWKIIWKLLFWSVIAFIIAVILLAIYIPQMEARKKYQQIGIHETAARGHYSRAKAAIDKGDTAVSSKELGEAVSELDKAMRLGPGLNRKSHILEFLGDINLAAGDKALAAKRYKAALDIRDEYAEKNSLKEKLDKLLKDNE